MSNVPPSILKYFMRKKRFRFLVAWSADMDKLYNQFSFLRSLVIEDIDLKEDPSLSFQGIQRNLFAKIGVRIVAVEGGKQITYDPTATNLEGLIPLVIWRYKQAVRNKKITDSKTLEEITQTHYSNIILKQRSMGFRPKALIHNAYRYWNWCADIADLCNSFLPVFERLAKEEVHSFPFLDKDLQETAAACNRMMEFLQEQTQTLKKEDLRLALDNPHVGQKVKPASRRKPRGGIITPDGSDVLSGDVLIETSARANNLVRLELPADWGQQSWTIAKVYVRPGDTLEAEGKLLTISALNIRAEQEEFLKLFYDVCREDSKVRHKAVMLREAVRWSTGWRSM